jgi:chromosomal replication initiator protein
MDKNLLWQNTLDEIKKTTSFSTFNLFFQNTSIISIDDHQDPAKVSISTPNAFNRDSLKKRFKNTVDKVLSEKTGKKCQTEYISNPKTQPNGPNLFSQETSDYLEKQTKENQIKNSIRNAFLKESFTFENFAVSPSNEVAYAAATAVAKNPGSAYNPLFLYGDVGVGKTHLMQAVGIRLLENKPTGNLVYCPGEQFTNEIIEAIRGKKTPQFRNKYRKTDILLIDDVQFIAGKNTVQEEFFHTFNAIQSNGGQIILTSDRPPHEIKLLEDRLRSRFEEGLTIDIQEPNFELRTAILLIKSKQMNHALPMDAAQEIAFHITSTRKLQGFLSKLFAVTGLKKVPITKEVVSQLLKKRSPEENDNIPRPYINPKEIVKGISKYYDIPLQTLCGPRRSKPIVVPRQYAMYLLKSDLGISYVEIGKMFGDRDHTTVMYAVEKVGKILRDSPETQLEFSTLRKQIYG